MPFKTLAISLFRVLVVLTFPAYGSVAGESLISEQKMINQIQARSPELIFLADTDHNNGAFIPMFSSLVEALTTTDRTNYCIFLETDRELFQPAITQYMNNEKTWTESVGIAQQKWEKLTGRHYKQAPELFLAEMKRMRLNVQAVDWSDKSAVSLLMRRLFKKGFSGDKTSLMKAFQLGVTSRNGVMADNISDFLHGTETQRPQCNKGIMIVGSLHLALSVDMSELGLGTLMYKSIAQFEPLRDLKAVAVEILDCSKLNNLSSQENKSQCRLAIQNFSSLDKLPLNSKNGKSLRFAFGRSTEHSTGPTLPSIEWNMMLVPDTKTSP